MPKCPSQNPKKILTPRPLDARVSVIISVLDAVVKRIKFVALSDAEAELGL